MAHSRALARAVFVVLAAGSLATKYPYGKDKYCFWGVGTGWCSGTGYTWCLLTDYCDVNADCAGDNYCPLAATWSSCKQDWLGFGRNGCCTKDRVCPAAPVAPAGCSWSCGSADCCDYPADKSCAAGLTVRTVGWSTCNNGLAANKDFYVCCEPPKAKSGGGGGGGGGAVVGIALGITIPLLCCMVGVYVWRRRQKDDGTVVPAIERVLPAPPVPGASEGDVEMSTPPVPVALAAAKPMAQVVPVVTSQPRFDPNTGQPLAPQPRFDPNTGQPLAPQPRFDPNTGQPLAPQPGPNTGL